MLKERIDKITEGSNHSVIIGGRGEGRMVKRGGVK